MITSFITQDTIKPQLVIRVKTNNLIPDSVFRKLDEAPAHIKYIDSIRSGRRSSAALPEVTITDTTSVCTRNSITDITFSDPSGLAGNFKAYPQGQFPFRYSGKTGSVSNDYALTVIQPLKDGDNLPPQPLHHDWITVIIFLSAFLWLVIRATTRSIFPELTRFLLFRGVNESSSRDTGSLFYWQSTVQNFVSFLIIALFMYCAAAYYDFLPGGIRPFLFMLISLVTVIFGITSRHFICLAAGNLSSETEAFNEYLMTIYQSYRFSSIIVFFILVCLLYTVILPPQVYLITGVIVLIIFYLYRVARLLLIFTKRNISILYLILYLCALEILPVLILLKYITGLI
jgi:hypothetical protein